MGRQEAEMLHRFRLVKGAKTADSRLGGIFESQQVLEGKFVEGEAVEAGNSPRVCSRGFAPSWGGGVKNWRAERLRLVFGLDCFFNEFWGGDCRGRCEQG